MITSAIGMVLTVSLAVVLTLAALVVLIMLCDVLSKSDDAPDDDEHEPWCASLDEIGCDHACDCRLDEEALDAIAPTMSGCGPGCGCALAFDEYEDEPNPGRDAYDRMRIEATTTRNTVLGDPLVIGGQNVPSKYLNSLSSDGDELGYPLTAQQALSLHDVIDDTSTYAGITDEQRAAVIEFVPDVTRPSQPSDRVPALRRWDANTPPGTYYPRAPFVVFPDGVCQEFATADEALKAQAEFGKAFCTPSNPCDSCKAVEAYRAHVPATGEGL